MSPINGLLVQWHEATGNAKWGVQRVFHDVLSLAAEGKTTLIYGSDYRNGSPCLVNTVGAMLTSHITVPLGGGQGIPSDYFGDIVRLFDAINLAFEEYPADKPYNDKPGYVSEDAAATLVMCFAEFIEEPTTQAVGRADDPYYEPSDEQIAKEMVELFTLPNCDEDVHMATENDELHAMLPVVPRHD